MMVFQNEIIEAFEPTFKSVKKDCTRYSDALCQLIDNQTIEARDYIRLSGSGSLWIAFQYIDNGHFDLVEADIRRDVTSRDAYGPLFANTRAVLKRLLDLSEEERVFSLYRAAIMHRVKALKAEVATQSRSKPGSNAWKAGQQWVETYRLPALEMIEEYMALLETNHRNYPEAQAFKQSVQDIELPQSGR